MHNCCRGRTAVSTDPLYRGGGIGGRVNVKRGVGTVVDLHAWFLAILVDS